MSIGYKQKIGENTWRLWVSNGFDAQGNRIRPSMTFHGTERQADEALAMFVADVKRESYKKPDKTICRDLFRRWLDTYGKFNLADSTYETFERYLMNRVCKTFIATVQVQKLNSADFYRLYNELREKYNYSNKTLLQIHRIMHSAFSDAMGWSELQLDRHPMTGVKAPKPEEKPVVRLNEGQAAHFLNTALKHAEFWFFVFISTVFTSGLRRGEVLGLRKMDILKGQNKLSIWQSVYRKKGEGLKFKTPKSGKPRTVSVPRDTIELLLLFIERTEKERGHLKDTDLIFSNEDGSPISPDKVSHMMKDFREKHGLPDITIHGGRHTNATILINKGVSLKEVSEHLGHSTTQITDTIYTEVWEETKQAVADKLEGLIPKLDKPNQEANERKDNVIPFRRKIAK